MVIEKFKKFCLHKKAGVLISVITDKVMRVSQQYAQVSSQVMVTFWLSILF